jgi:hypothetical protein
MGNYSTVNSSLCGFKPVEKRPKYRVYLEPFHAENPEFHE